MSLEEIINYSLLFFSFIIITGSSILIVLFFIRTGYRLFIDFIIEREAYKKRRRKT